MATTKIKTSNMATTNMETTKYNTIHVFGNGTVQIIAKDLNKQVPAKDLQKLKAVVDGIVAKKPEDVSLTEYHVIHIFQNDARYLGKGNVNEKTSFSVPMKDLDSAAIDKLVDELLA